MTMRLVLRSWSAPKTRRVRLLILVWLIWPALLLGTTAMGAPDPSSMPDSEFFAKFDLSRAGLERVRTMVEAQRYEEAKQALVDYYRNRAGFNLNRPEPKAADTRELLEHRFTFFRTQTVDVDEPDGSGNVDWFNIPPTVDGTWFRLLLRFNYLETVLASYLHDQKQGGQADPAGVINMLEVVADYIGDVANNSAAGPGFGGPLQTANRMHVWARCYPHYARIPETDPNRLAGMLKHLWQMADFTAQEPNFLGYSNNRGMLQTNALQFVATYFPEFRDSLIWEKLNQDRLTLYLESNIHANGVLGEPTTHYHRSQTAAITDLLGVTGDNGRDVLPPAAGTLLNRMFTYYGDYALPNGQIFAIGDTSFSAEFPAMGKFADRLGREDLRYITSRGREGIPPAHTSALYRQGSAVMRNGWERDSVVAFIENQPPGSHHHPDNLALSIYAFGDQLITNSGRQSYDPADMSGVWHAAETEANSTVQIDGRPMRTFGEKVDAWISQPGFDFFRGHYTDALAAAIAPTDDTYVDGGKPDTHFASAPGLLVHNGPGAQSDRMVYLKFRVGAILEPLGGSILRLYSTEPLAGPLTLHVYGLKHEAVASIEADWNEHNVSWNSRSRAHPADDAVIAGADAVRLGTLEIAGPGWYQLATPELTAFIADQAKGNGHVTLVIADELKQAVQITFGSQQSGHSPSLALQLQGGRPWSEAITHHRSIYYDRKALFVVSDLLEGAEHAHSYEQLWSLNNHTAEGSPVMDVDHAMAKAQFMQGGKPHASLRIVSADAGQLSAAELKDGWVSKAQTGKQPNKRVAFTRESRGATTFDTVITLGKDAADPDLTVERLPLARESAADGSSALRIHLDRANGGDVVTYFSTRFPGRMRDIGAYAFDGEVLAVREGPCGRIKSIDIKGGTTLRRDGRGLVASAREIHDLTVDLSVGDLLRLTSTEPLGQELSIAIPASEPTNVEFNGRPLTGAIRDGTLVLRGNCLFEADFESGTADRWSMTDPSAWRVGELTHRYVLEARASATPQTALMRGSNWGDVEIEGQLQFDVRPPGPGSLGLVVRSADDANHYRFVYEAASESVQIVRRVGGTDTPLAAKKHPLSHGAPFKMGASAIGDRLRLYVNDSLVISAVDHAFEAGQAGLYQHQTSGFADDVFVTSGAGGTPIPAEQSFCKEITASANGYVGDNAPVTNQFDHFSAAEFRARLPVVDGGPGRRRISYVGFDLGDDAGRSINRAVLRLYRAAEEQDIIMSQGAMKVFAIQRHDWNDRQLTWEDSPNHALDASQAVGADCRELATLAPAKAGWLEIDVSEYVKAHPGQRRYSFMLVAADPGKTALQFHSNLYPLKPRLRIEGGSR